MVSSWRLLSLSTFCKCSGLSGNCCACNDGHLNSMVSHFQHAIRFCDQISNETMRFELGLLHSGMDFLALETKEFLVAFPRSCFVFVTGFHESWLCNIEKLPQVIGVLTHLDSFKENKQLRKVLL